MTTVTAILPAYANPGEVRRALASVAAQTRPPDEVIVIDDASPDAAPMAAAADERGATLIRLRENGGPGIARQAGIDAATGAVLAFLDTDDLWHPRKLEWGLAAMARGPFDLLGHRKAVATDGEPFAAALPDPVPPRPLGRSAFLRRNPIPTSSLMVRREFCREVFAYGGRRSEDHAALLLMLHRGAAAGFLDQPLCAALRPYFVSGAGADVVAMKAAGLRNARRLRRDGVLSRAELAQYVAFWAIKYPVVMLRAARARRA
jgi:glycosyltransferase involved in cell wall biosynthesis